jgi:hypothetical protein
MIEQIDEQEAKSFPTTETGTDDDNDEVNILGSEEREMVVMQSIKSV